MRANQESLKKEPDGLPETGGGAPLLFPCSSSQQRCWFINSLNPGNPALNVALRWEATGRLSPETAEQAFQAIVDRHEILRSSFFEKDGEAMQEAAPSVAFQLSTIDLSMLPEAERMAEALAQGEREAHTPFDLGQAPPIRVTFLQLAEDLAFLLVTVHQIAFDGWSIRVLAQEFGAIAEAINARRRIDLPQPPLQYGDYCLWQREYLSSGSFEAETAFWKGKLGGAPYFEVEPDHERTARPTYKGVIIAETLPQDLGERVEEAARSRNLTLFSFGCAVLGAALHRYTDEDDVIFGTQIAGRDDPDLENLIGMFINNLVMRFDASGEPTFETFLARVNATAQDALINQRMPFDRLVEILNPPRDPRRTPLISVNFTVLRDVMDHKSYGDFLLRGQPSLSAGSLYDLIFFMVHWPSGWRVALEYNPDLFEAETAQKLLAFVMRTFEFAVSRPGEKLSALEPPARDRIDVARNRDVLALVEDVLVKHADVRMAGAVAVADGAPYAFVAPRSDYPAPLESLPHELLAYLERMLPLGAARPAGLSVLLDLPRTRRGAINYRRLPTPPAIATPSPAADDTRLSQVEARLAAVWRDLLKVDDVGPQANFFELGGHSLLSIRLMNRVNAEFGVKLDPVALFQAPTLRAFAARLPQGEGVEPSPRLVQIQPDGDKTPIIAINNSMLYYTLARQIGLDRPFIGIPLAMPQADGAEAAPRTLNEIAADYVRLIREAQPHGPYILCGLCVAGAIAYECAQQLTAKGEQAPLLILSDMWAPGYLASYSPPRKLLYQMNYRFRTLLHRLAMVARGDISVAEVLSMFTLVRKTRVLDFLVALGVVDGGKLARKVVSREEWSFLLSLEAARNSYQIKPIKSDVMILASEEIVTRFADPKMGWSGLVEGRLMVHRIPGWHEAMFKDAGAEAIAGRLRPFLDELDVRIASSGR